MKFKKIITVLLIISVFASCTIGCAKKKAQNDNPESPDQNIDTNTPSTPNDSGNDTNTPEAPGTNTQTPPPSSDTTPPDDEKEDEPTSPDDQSAKDTLEFESNGDGTCTLVGIGEYTDACLVIPEKNASGESVTDISEKAFYSCPTLTAVQIPASVVRIGDLAFGDCSNLIYIGVNSANEHYKDVAGVLYTFDGKELITYPAAKAGSYTTIDDGVEKIHSMAFYACKYLRTVYYAGDCEEWDEITVGSKNYSLTAASIQYSVNGK